MSMSLLAFALSYLGMLLLCLTMNRHRAALLRGDLRLPTTPVMRLLAMGCFGFAGWLCIGSQDAEIGTVVWLCLTMLAGVLLAAMFFANKVGHYLDIRSELDGDGSGRTYRVVGQVFFSSSDKFTAAFDFKEALARVTIDLSQAHFWDITAVSALDKVVLKFRREGTEVQVLGLNEASATIVDRFGVHDKPDAIDSLMGH